MSHLKDLANMDKESRQFGSATHVITKILYGAEANFVFSHAARNIRDKRSIYGEISVTANFSKIPNCAGLSI